MSFPETESLGRLWLPFLLTPQELWRKVNWISHVLCTRMYKKTKGGTVLSELNSNSQLASQPAMESAMLRRAVVGTASLSAGSLQAFVGLPPSLVHSPLPLSLSGIGPSEVKLSRRRSSSLLQKTITTTTTRTTSTPRAALVPLPLPSEFGYVILTAATAAIIVQWQAIEVSRQRVKAKVPYPKMYEDAEPSLFNCYQRAHQNTLETVPSFLALLAIGGLGYPVTSAAFGMLWCVGRVVYSLGYYTGEPKNRLKGMFHFFAFVGLIGTCIVLGVRQTGLLARFGI